MGMELSAGRSFQAAGRRILAFQTVCGSLQRRVQMCQSGNYLRIRAGCRELNANRRALFANEKRGSVMIFPRSERPLRRKQKRARNAHTPLATDKWWPDACPRHQQPPE